MPLLPVHTRGEGDCAFHAAFGQWDDKAQEFVHQDIQALRKRVADTVRISIAGQLIFPSIIAAIDELIRSTTRVIDLTGFPIIQRLKTQFHTTQSVDLDWTHQPMIEEYARIIETPGVWLLPCELSIIAHACQISIRHFIGKRTQPFQIQEYNPGHTMVNVYFDGRNHYEGMRENGVFHPSYSGNTMDIDPAPSLTLLPVGNYAASGLKHTLHGNVYQLKLLIWLLYRASMCRYPFRLATEMDQAKKFDDSVLIFHKPGIQQPHYLFLQAKHKQDDDKVITDKDLLDTSDQDFSLLKYFASYQAIHGEPDFQHGASYQFYLCTNIGLDFDPANDKDRIFKLANAFEVITDVDEMFDTGEPNAMKYRFKQGNFPGKTLLYGTLRGNKELILASSLFAIMQNPKGKIDKTQKPFNDKVLYQKLLDNKIINDQTRRLSNDFISAQHLTPYAAQFKTLYTAVESTRGEAWVDEEIDKFLQHLVLAVTQPNEIRLGEIIAKALGEEFNLIDSDFIYAELQKAMLDWMKQKTGSFLSDGSAEKFFQTMRQKLSQLVLIGSTIDQQEELKRYDIAFNPVPSIRDFLHGSNRKLTYQTSGDILLNSIQVYQTLQGIPKYQKNDSYIFITLKRAMRIRDLVINAFTQYPLLVLICETNPIQEEIDQLIQPLLYRSQSSRKILVVISMPESITSEGASLIKAVHNFASLTPSSQQKLQAWPIVFQGQPTTLGELVPDVASLIDTDVLTELLLHKEIHIGQELERFEAEDYYIERSFIGSEILKEALEENKTDTFVISSLAQDTLNQKINVANEQSERYIAIESPHDALVQFQQIRPANPKNSIHLLVYKNNAFIWYRTKGSLTHLRQYVKPTFLEPLSNKTFILSAEPGMGKSTLVSHLAHTLKANHPDAWAIKINLLDKEEAIKHSSFRNEEDMFDFFIPENSALAHKIFKYHFKKTENIVILLDGFDEIQIEQQEKIIQLLQQLNSLFALKHSKINRIVVSTRPHLRQKLEDALGIFAYSLKPFYSEDLIHFLTQFWQKNLALDLLDIDRVRVYAKELINLFSRLTNDTERAFIGIPLQAKLFAVAFADNFKTFYITHARKPELPEVLSLSGLYHHFIESKYEILFREKFGADSYNAFSYIKHSLTAVLEECHQLLAFNILFPEFKYSEEKINPHIELIKRAGLVQLNEGKSHEFIHRTFAEYFAAGFLIDRLQDPSSYQKTRAFLIGHIFKDQHTVIRSFIEDLTQESQNAELKQAWQAIVTGQLLASQPINPLLTLIDSPSPTLRPQQDISPEEIGRTFIQTREAFEEHIRQFDLNKSRQSTYNFCNALLQIQDIDQVNASLPLLSRALKNPIPGYINDEILHYLPGIFWHYLTLCSNQGKIFDNTLLQAFRNARYSVNHYLKYTTMESDCLDQLAQLHHYMTISQTIDPQFVDELDLAKVLYLVFDTAFIPSELVEPLSKQLQKIYPQLNPYLINNRFYQELIINLPCIYPAFTQGVKAFLLEPKADYSLQGKMGELIYQLYRVKPETRPTPEEMEHIFTHAPRYSFACSSEEAISLIYCFKLLTPKLGKNISAELFSTISAKKFGDVAAERYNETVWNRLLLPLLHELQPYMLTDGIDPIALLSLCSDFFAYARGSEINRQFSLSTLALQNLLQLLEQTLNQPELSAKTFFRCMWLLTQLNYEGFHLLDLGAAIVVQHPTAEFEYLLQLSHKKPIFDLLSLRPKPTGQDVEVFAPACANTLQIIQQTRPKLKQTTSNPEISPSAERKVEVVSLTRNIKRGRSGAEEPDMDYPLAPKRHKHRGMEEKSEV